MAFRERTFFTIQRVQLVQQWINWQRTAGSSGGRAIRSAGQAGNDVIGTCDFQPVDERVAVRVGKSVKENAGEVRSENRTSNMKPAHSAFRIFSTALALLLCGPTAQSAEATHDSTSLEHPIDAGTLRAWSAPFRNWHYWPDHVIPASPPIPGITNLLGTDVPSIYQIPGDDKWYLSFVGFDGLGYQSYVAESDDLLHWDNYRLAMGYGPKGEFDHGGRVIGAYLYESYELRALRVLKRKDGKFWSLYGAYPRQGGYELRPGSEGLAVSDDGVTWKRVKNQPVLSVFDPDCGVWEKDCIYQPWLLEHQGRYFDFYNAARGSREQTGLAFSCDLLNWMRYPANPVVRNRPGG